MKEITREMNQQFARDAQAALDALDDPGDFENSIEVAPLTELNYVRRLAYRLAYRASRLEKFSRLPDVPQPILQEEVRLLEEALAQVKACISPKPETTTN